MLFFCFFDRISKALSLRIFFGQVPVPVRKVKEMQVGGIKAKHLERSLRLFLSKVPNAILIRISDNIYLNLALCKKCSCNQSSTPQHFIVTMRGNDEYSLFLQWMEKLS